MWIFNFWRYNFIFLLINCLIKCEKIVLKPRTIKFKKLHKPRKILIFQPTPFLKTGTSGLLLLQPLRLKSIQIYRFTLFLKKAVKKFDKTKRLFWFYAFPHFPLTRKPIGARMGKGKGKAKKWYSLIHGGVTLVEFLHLRSGRALYFMRQLKLRISAKSTPVFNNKFFITQPLNGSRRMRIRSFW